jgi:hypothetical protein
LGCGMNFQILAIGYRFVFLFKLIKNERLEIEWGKIFFMIRICPPPCIPLQRGNLDYHFFLK